MSRTPDDAPGAPGAPGALQAPRTSRAEWGVALLGLLLVVGAVAFLLLDAVRSDGAPPDVAVRADSVTPAGGGYLVRFTAVNRGRQTAAGVEVVGELRDAAGVETRRVTLDYVPGRSARRGGLFFRRDPRRAALQLRAEGYQEP